jgi:nicotinamide riboside kinase
MIGYCQKWREHREYQMIQRGMSDADLEKGRRFLQVFKTDYTKDKFLIDTNNVLKAAYAYWTGTRKPVFVLFSEIMLDMIQSGDFVISGKMLSSQPLDRGRTEAAWKSMLTPYETSADSVSQIMFGSTKKPVLGVVSSSRYTVEDFTPCAEDALTIQFLQHHLITRRENVVLIGPAGTGKSCLIEALTSAFGCQFFGTADELKEISDEVQFAVFDDFDFKDFTKDDIKRLLDREFTTQRLKVRYADAVLRNKTTRIVLCNTLPSVFDDAAIFSRTHVKYITAPLFAESQRTKFRGTHLLADEDYTDHDNDDSGLFEKMAWGRGFRFETKEAVASNAEFESKLTAQGESEFTVSAKSVDADMALLRASSLISSTSSKTSASGTRVPITHPDDYRRHNNHI